MIPEVNKYYYVNITKDNSNSYCGIAHCVGLRGIDLSDDKEKNYWVFNGATWGWNHFELMVWCGEEENVVISEGTKEEYDILLSLDKERIYSLEKILKFVKFEE